MKRIFLIVILIILLITCKPISKKENVIGVKVDSTNNLDTYVISTEKKLKQDSIKRKRIETNLWNLKADGVFGQWDCTVSGIESIISLKKNGNNYSSLIEYPHKNNEQEILKKIGNKYFVNGSTAGEYYVINEVGNLELWDNKGLFTTIQNIMPGVDITPLPKFDINNAIGQKIFLIKTNYSKVKPETLTGTNANYWIVYLADINSTFKVDKRTDKIEKAQVGRITNLN